MALTREQILAHTDLPKEEVSVPEWGGTVFVRTLTGTERDQFEQSMFEATHQRNGKKTAERKINLRNVRARLLALCIVDDAGQRMFQDHEDALLGKLSGAALDRLFSVAQRLSRLTPEDVEELVGNSGTAPSGGSGSS